MWTPRLGINANLEAISNTHTHTHTLTHIHIIGRELEDIYKDYQI